MHVVPHAGKVEGDGTGRPDDLKANLVGAARQAEKEQLGSLEAHAHTCGHGQGQCPRIVVGAVAVRFDFGPGIVHLPSPGSGFSCSKQPTRKPGKSREE